MEYYLLIVSMMHFADEARLLENEIALKTFDFGDLPQWFLSVLSNPQ